MITQIQHREVIKWSWVAPQFEKMNTQKTIIFGLVWLHAPIYPFKKCRKNENKKLSHPLGGAARPWDLVTWANRKSPMERREKSWNQVLLQNQRILKKASQIKTSWNIPTCQLANSSFLAPTFLLLSTKGLRFQAARRSLSPSHTTSHARSNRVGTPRLM